MLRIRLIWLDLPISLVFVQWIAVVVLHFAFSEVNLVWSACYIILLFLLWWLVEELCVICVYILLGALILLRSRKGVLLGLLSYNSFS